MKRIVTLCLSLILLLCACQDSKTLNHEGSGSTGESTTATALQTPTSDHLSTDTTTSDTTTGETTEVNDPSASTNTTHSTSLNTPSSTANPTTNRTQHISISTTNLTNTTTTFKTPIITQSNTTVSSMIKTSTTTHASSTKSDTTSKATTSTKLTSADAPSITTSTSPTYTTQSTTTSTTKVTALSTTSQSSTTSSTTIHTTESSTITFRVTIRDSITKQPIPAVSLTVYNDQNKPLGQGESNPAGVVSLLTEKSASYRVVINAVPESYAAEAEYHFRTNTVNIALRKTVTPTDHSGAQYKVGSYMSEFVLTDIDGKEYRLSDLQDEKKLIILDFWYVDCVFCVEEFPFFEAAYQKYGDSIALLALDPVDYENAMCDFRDKRNQNPKTPITFPLVRDTCNLFTGFSVFTYPTTIFITSDGEVVNIHTGAYPSADSLFAEIDKYLT